MQKHIFILAEELNDLIINAVQTGLSAHSIPSTESQIDLITAEQLRERLDICKASERSYVQAGILKPRYLGRKVFYRWEDVIASLSSKGNEYLPPKLRNTPKHKAASK